jgi:DUF4097 and DUF4098 domain-containing protein YvlB
MLWTGCKGGIDKTLVQVVEETHPLNPAGTLQVKNVDGTIRLYGWSNPEVQIKATKKAYSVERLRGITTQISSHPDSLSIETVFPPGKKWSLRDRSGVVEYVIVIPKNLKTVDLELVNGEISIEGLRDGSARASLVNGRISASNCFANLDYEAKNGAIDFYYKWWEARTYHAQATIPNGSIGVFLPENASFHVEAETRGGVIISNLIDEDEKPPDHRKKLARTFGSERGPTFKFNAGNGNIRVQGY